MNATVLRGAAALCLLALAPCARAVTVTQTLNSTVSIPVWSGWSGHVNINHAWSLAPAGPGLTNVILLAEWHVDAGTIDRNFTGSPLVDTPWIKLFSDGISTIGQLLASASGPTVVIPAYINAAGAPGYTMFSSSLHGVLFQDITAPALLASFSNPTRIPYGLNSEIYASGELSGQATVNATLTYVYTDAQNAPDGGFTFTLLACAVLLVLYCHRRLKRNLPTL